MFDETLCLSLPWPLDTGAGLENQIFLPGSNVVYDFHGDPCQADLTIVMEGNQFMVIPDLLEIFYRFLGRRVEVFYVTLPPGRFRGVLSGEPLAVGNLILSLRPQIVMAPPEFMEKVRDKVFRAKTFMKNRGVVLVFRRGNPKNIQAPEDLLRPEVRVAISNPKTEAHSFKSYTRALEHIPELLEKIAREALKSRLIHHREVPALIFHDYADVAPLYYHFAYYYQNPRFFREPLFDFLSFPEGEKGVSFYQVAFAKGAEENEIARAWYEFLDSPEARETYARHGFALFSSQA